MEKLTADYWQYLERQQQNLKKKVMQDPWRLHYHLMPETGWMNDPNGLCQFKGIYHFYHQYVPTDPENGEPLHWGHKTSRDLIHFQEEDLFLSPVHEYNCDGVYSGSAFVKEDELHFFYTGNVKHLGDYDYIFNGREQNTIHVVSHDGFIIDHEEVVLSYEDYPEDLTPHVRDPKVFEKNGCYYMLLGARTKDNEGKVLIYQSEDLQEWRYQGHFFGDHYSLGYMWECPDFFEINGQAVLVFSPQGVPASGYEYQNVYQSGYLLGEVDWEQLRFKESSRFIEFDRGFDFYAPQTFEDEQGRRILFAWMGIGDTQPEYINPTIARGWQHAATLPRELVFEADKLKQKPLTDYQKLRQNEILSLYDSDKEQEPLRLEGEIFELLIEFQKIEENFSLKLRQDTEIFYDKNLLTLCHGFSGFGRKKRSIVLEQLDSLQLFVDTSSLELFVNGGEYVMTSRFYPEYQSKDIILELTGRAVVKKWELHSRR